MQEFLFRKDLWSLDFVSSMVFALCMSAFVQHWSDSGQYHFDRILFAVLVGESSYLMTFILALPLRKKVTWVRSWAWMGITGALIQIIVRALIAFPDMLNYFQRFYPTFSDAVKDLLSSLVIGLVSNWVLWAILGSTFILSVRFCVYSLRSVNRTP